MYFRDIKVGGGDNEERNVLEMKNCGTTMRRIRSHFIICDLWVFREREQRVSLLEK